MKCKIKSSGEIVDVIGWRIDGAYTDYVKDGIEIKSILNYYKDFEPIVENNIDWEQRRYELARVAMQGILSNPDLTDKGWDGIPSMIKACICYADELIKQLKEKQNEI